MVVVVVGVGAGVGVDMCVGVWVCGRVMNALLFPVEGETAIDLHLNVSTCRFVHSGSG